MLEEYEFRMAEESAAEVLGPGVGENIGLARRVTLYRDDPLFSQLGEVQREWRARGRPFLLSWDIRRSYGVDELENAEYLRLIPVPVYEPTGVECGTTYDDTNNCPECGFGRRQMSSLRVDQRRLPRGKDLAQSIAGDEWLISRHASDLLSQGAIEGAAIREVEECRGHHSIDGWRQLSVTSPAVGIASRTLAGVGPFDLDDAGTYRCSLGHTIGLNLLSELSVLRRELPMADIAATRQAVGVRRGLLVPHQLLLVSQRLYRILKDAKLKGWRVERAHVV